MAHILLALPIIPTFLEYVTATIKQLTLLDVTQNLAACLTDRPFSKYKTSLMLHKFNAAKACIPMLWRHVHGGPHLHFE